MWLRTLCTLAAAYIADLLGKTIANKAAIVSVTIETDKIIEVLPASLRKAVDKQMIAAGVEAYVRHNNSTKGVIVKEIREAFTKYVKKHTV